MAVRIKSSESTLEQAVQNAGVQVEQLRMQADKAEQKKRELQLLLEKTRAEARRKEQAEQEGAGIERQIEAEASGG